MRIGSPLVLTVLTLLAAGPAVAQGTMAGRAYDQERLGAAGLQKCAAYRRVRMHSDSLQAADHGRLTPRDTSRLTAELARARSLPPKRLTPADCGVPL